MRDELGLAIFLPERDLYDRAGAAVAAALGVDTAAARRTDGRRMSPAEYTQRAETVLTAIVSDRPAANESPPQRGGQIDASIGLTQRETEVLQLLAEGMTNAQLAERLSISPSTVSSHLERIFVKLDVTTRGAAVAMAHRLGIAGSG